MSMSPLVFELADNVQEICYIITDTFRINEIISFCSSQVQLLDRYLFAKFSNAIDDGILSGGEHLDNVRQISFNHSIQIVSTSQVLDNRRAQRNLDAKKSQNLKNHNRKHELKTSTPLNHEKESKKASNSSEVIDMKYRLFNLEQEIIHLKKQVETLSKTKEHCCFNNSYSLPPIQEISEPYIPPPPPPPPPPPSTPSQVHLPLIRKSCKPLGDHNDNCASQKLDMVTVLRGLKDVKLKPTDRSPGGTPMRKTKPLSDNHLDVLQKALKKRFKSIHPMEACNKENVTDSWEKSPSRSFISDDELLSKSRFWENSS